MKPNLSTALKLSRRRTSLTETIYRPIMHGSIPTTFQKYKKSNVFKGQTEPLVKAFGQIFRSGRGYHFPQLFPTRI